MDKKIVDGGKDAAAPSVSEAQSALGMNSEKINELLKSEQAEKVSDSILDSVAGAVKKAAPQHASKVDIIRDQLDRKIGNE